MRNGLNENNKKIYKPSYISLYMEIKQKILDALTNELKTIAQITKKVGSNWYYVRSELKELKSEGLAYEEKLGRITYYKLMEKPNA